MEAPESDGESLAPLRFAFGGSRDPVALVAQTLDVASRLPAHAAGDTPAVLAAPLRAARKEQVVVIAGASGMGKSGLLNDLYRASKVSAAEYASAAAEAALRDGARLELETYTPAPQERWRAAPPRLMPEQVQPGAEVDVHISCDDIWVPGRVLAVRTRAGGVIEARVAEYDVLKDEHGGTAVDNTGALIYSDALLDASEFKAVSCCDEAAPAAIGTGIALRHVRTCRGAVEVADAPLVKGQHAAARNVRPVKEAELDRYDGLLPEGAVGHTTEVREQVLVHGPLLGVTLVFAPYAPTAAAHAKLRAVLLAREAAPPAKRPDLDKALAAFMEGDDPLATGGGGGVSQDAAADDDDDEAPVSSTALTKREMELARAALGLPPGFNLALLKPADVPAELPREVAALLGRAVRFSPTCVGVRGDVQAAHERAVKRFLASNTRAVWQPGPAGGKPQLLWGNPLVSIIDRVVITTPCAAVGAGRVLVDTRGAERASLSAALAAANDATRSATAASLADAGAAVLMADARTDSTAVLDAARDGGIINELATAALKAHIEEARGIPRQPRNVRVAVVIVGDKAWRDDALAALRGSGPNTRDAMDRLRNLLEAVAFAGHKAALRDEIKTALLIKVSDHIDDATAHACAERVLSDEVEFIAVYPRIALGHAATPSIPPPASAAEADELAQKCGLVKLARFISGDGDGAAARAAAAKAAAALRRGLAALGHELALHKESPDALDRLRVYSHQVAPLADRIVVLHANAGGASAAAALDLGAWKTQLMTQLRPELQEMAATLEGACTCAEYGRVIAALIGHPFSPDDTPVPPSEFTGARADAAAEPLRTLARTGELGGMQLHELCIGPAVNWERGPTPDIVYGGPPMPPSLVFNWTQGAGVTLLTPAPCAEAQIWATLRCALGRVHDVARRGVASLTGASEEDKARLHALLAVREADFAASVQRLVVDRFESINYAFSWREAEDSARAAGAAAAAAVLERARKGKQASIVPKSEHKSVKSTKMWQIERGVPRVAAAAAAAYTEAAYSTLSDMASSLIADVHELVQKHCDELAKVSDGALSQLNGGRLWDALDTHVAATALAARLERMAAASAAAPAEQLPERLLPRALVVALCQKLRAQLPTGATLGDALTMPADAHANAMLDAAAAAAQSSSASAAASARALLARWRKPGDDPARRAAWCRATLRTLQLAFGASASLRDSEPLRQFLCSATSSDGDDVLPASEAKEWPEEQTFALLCLCTEAGALAGTAAFPRIQAAGQLPRAERDWLMQVTRLLSSQCAAGSSALGPGTPPERKTAADRRAPQDWLNVRVRKLFVDPEKQLRRWYDGEVTAIVARRGGGHWYRIVYDEDGDCEDIELPELAAAAAAAALHAHRGAPAPASPPPAAAAQADAANPAWPQRSVEAVRRHVSLLQLSAAGGGPDVLSALRARFAPDRGLLLREDDGWVVARTVTKRGGVGDVQFCYYGNIGADGKPTGMPAGRSVNDAGLAPKRVFSGPGAWLQVHHFRNGVEFVLPGGGGAGGVRLSAQEEQAVRDAMTPRTVTRDGVPCPDEYVAEPLSEHRLGTWRWEFITRPQGDTKGTVDRYYHAPDGARMRSLAEVQRHVAGRSGRLVDNDGDDSDDDVRTPARGGKKRALPDEAEPGRLQGKRQAKDKTERGFYAGQDD